jgi:hypothetical protein
LPSGKALEKLAEKSLPLLNKKVADMNKKSK